MRNKIEGALYGLALGDSMGMPAELWGRKKTKEFFGSPITGFLDGPKENSVACNYKSGQFTDDTGQALVILDSLNETNYIPNTRNIASKMLEWAKKENAFENNILGPTSKVALSNFEKGIEDSSITNGALSNGSAMRIAPIGCLFSPNKKRELVEYVYQVSKATHTSDVCIAGAAMIAVGVSSAIINNDFQEVLKDIYLIEELGYERGAETFSPKLSERIKIGIEIADKYYGNDELFLEKLYNIVGSGVCIIESVPAAISIAYYAKDPNKSALLSANLGGDTDTIGAMATSICGAFTGIEGIKKEYIDTLSKKNNINFDNYVHILEKGREVLNENIGSWFSNN